MGETPEVAIVDAFDFAATHGQAERGYAARLATISVVLSRRQTTKGDIRPGRADHQVGNGGPVGLDGITESVETPDLVGEADIVVL